MTTPTLGDFLALASQRITAAALYTGELPAAANADVVTELDRLLVVMVPRMPATACSWPEPSLLRLCPPERT